AGAPVAGAHVTAELASSQAVAMGLPGMDGGKSAVTGPDGRFRIDDLEAGRWRVRASRGSALKRTEREVELRGGEEKIEIVLPRGAIEGRVVRADDHQPVANASVSLVDADRGGPQRQMIMVAVTSDSDGSGPEIVTGDGMARTKTDADGKFRIDDLPAGKYRVKGTAAGLREGTSADISLGDDALVNGVELALEKAASLVGRVTSPSGGARPQTVVRAVPKDGPNGPPKIAVTDAEGRYRFTSLDPGEYRLFTGLNFGAAASAGQLVTLEAGKEATKDLVVED
ncbi:MAG TPA: carboxypeptidase-like regulatory domain-containing protein, partial [Planctomycetota bacterium]|nr:carboxypeptidase-like regulatory domain-containing protein [Planctomycetota bacterium]